MKSSQIQREMEALRQDILTEKDKYLEKIFTFSKHNIEKYNLKNTKKQKEEFFDIFLNALEKSFSLTSKALKKIYKETKAFSVDDIISLTYKEDGKTLDERILRWWDEAYNRLQKKEMTLDSACQYLLSKYDAILDNEMKLVSTAVKKGKKPIVEEHQHIIIRIFGCTCGKCPNGDFPEDYDLLPPFHAYCSCDWEFETTDDPDDIKDLDLEEEDQE